MTSKEFLIKFMLEKAVIIREFQEKNNLELITYFDDESLFDNYDADEIDIIKHKIYAEIFFLRCAFSGMGLKGILCPFCLLQRYKNNSVSDCSDCSYGLKYGKCDSEDEYNNYIIIKDQIQDVEFKLFSNKVYKEIWNKIEEAE